MSKNLIFALALLAPQLCLAHESLDPCEKPLEPTPSLETLHKGTAAAIFKTAKWFYHSKTPDRLLGGLETFEKEMEGVEALMAPRGNWLRTVRQKVHAMIMDGIRSSSGCEDCIRRVSAIVYEASFAAHVPSEDIFFDTQLYKIIPNLREMSNGKTKEVRHKEVDVAWFEGSGRTGKLTLVELKNTRPKFFQTAERWELEAFYSNTVGQSVYLNRALRALRHAGIEYETWLVIRTLNPDGAAELRRRGVKADKIYGFDAINNQDLRTF